MDFIKHYLKPYFRETIKEWKYWLALLLIFVTASLEKNVVDICNYFDLPSFCVNYSDKFFNWLKYWLKSLWWLIIVCFVLFIHLKATYQVWKEMKSDLSLVKQYDNVPNSYKAIMGKVESLLPEKSGEIRKNFATGYTCLTEAGIRDVNTAVSEHFSAYRIIREFLIEYFNTRNTSVPITVEISRIRAAFDKNFSELKRYNDRIGENKNPSIEERDILQLTDDINNNLKSLLAYF